MASGRSSLAPTIGVAGVVAVMALAIGLAVFKPSPPEALDPTPKPKPVAEKRLEPIKVTGIIGSDKETFFKNQKIKDLLAEKGITVETRTMSQFEITEEDMVGQDFVWHSSTVSMDFYKEKDRTAFPLKREDVPVRSPLVYYSWSPVTEKLIKKKIVTKVDGTYYLTDMDKFVGYLVDGKSWSELGVPLNKPVSLESTDPKSTNAGMLSYSVIGTVMNGGKPLTAANFDAVLPQLKTFFDSQGRLDSKNQWLINSFLVKGWRTKPMIASWESEMQAYALKNPSQAAYIKKNVNVIYPKPTIWSDHVLAATNDNGVRLIEALKDPKIQAAAWKECGFRTGLAGTNNDPKELELLGIPATVDEAIDVPKGDVMHRLMDGL